MQVYQSSPFYILRHTLRRTFFDGSSNLNRCALCIRPFCLADFCFAGAEEGHRRSCHHRHVPLGWIILGSPIGGLQTIFNGMVRAGIVLLDVVFIISVVVALAKSLETIDALQLMVNPFRKLMRGPKTAFWIVGIVMLLFALFIWPSPAVALIGTILFPAARAVGLPAISTAQAMNLFGHGVGLSGDFVIQAAPKLTAEAAGVCDRCRCCQPAA